MNKKPNKIPSAGTKADSEQKDENMQVSPAIAKPNVVCSQSTSNCKCKNYVLGSVNINRYKRWLLSAHLVEHGLNSFIKF
jgi:hypothetical protein